MLHFLNDHFSTNNVNIFQMFSLALTITLGNNGVGITEKYLKIQNISEWNLDYLLHNVQWWKKQRILPHSNVVANHPLNMIPVSIPTDL